LKRSPVTGAFALVVLLLFVASEKASAELDENLAFINPLVGTSWVGGYVGDDAPDIAIALKFESILGGKAVRYTREAPAADFKSVTHFFWSPQAKKALFFTLNNRGMVDEGTIELVGAEFVLSGKSHWGEKSIEFKTVLNLDQSGTLSDTFSRNEKGEWVLGHYQEFEKLE